MHSLSTWHSLLSLLAEYVPESHASHAVSVSSVAGLRIRVPTGHTATAAQFGIAIVRNKPAVHGRQTRLLLDVGATSSSLPGRHTHTGMHLAALATSVKLAPGSHGAHCASLVAVAAMLT